MPTYIPRRRLLPYKLTLHFLRKIFPRPGVVCRALRDDGNEAYDLILQNILEYHDAGALPCFAFQYDDPDLPPPEDPVWPALYARSAERYDHLKLKWWAINHLRNWAKELPCHFPSLPTSPIVHIETAALHSKIISDLAMTTGINIGPFFDSEASRFTLPAKVIPLRIAVECGDTEPDKLLMLLAEHFKCGTLFCVMPYFSMESRLAFLFLGTQSLAPTMGQDAFNFWNGYCNPEIGISRRDGGSFSAWGEVVFHG